jgi:hypothetical protein
MVGHDGLGLPPFDVHAAQKLSITIVTSKRAPVPLTIDKNVTLVIDGHTARGLRIDGSRRPVFRNELFNAVRIGGKRSADGHAQHAQQQASASRGSETQKVCSTQAGKPPPAHPKAKHVVAHGACVLGRVHNSHLTFAPWHVSLIARSRLIRKAFGIVTEVGRLTEQCTKVYRNAYQSANCDFASMTWDMESPTM